MGDQRDISKILKAWRYSAHRLNVRKIIGDDGRTKIQMRLDLGILQMEMSGRPDGKRPWGKESILDLFQSRLAKYRKKMGTDKGFCVTSKQCDSLRLESIQYYHRYLCLAHLRDYEGVIRDTEHNLRVLDFVDRYAESDDDAWSFIQFRPFILMMNTQARMEIFLRDGKTDLALKLLENRIKEIEDFYEEYGLAEEMESPEIETLLKWKKEIEKSSSSFREVKIRERLLRAIASENYEEAARLRDQLKMMHRKKK
jgi:hypothetical protein